MSGRDDLRERAISAALWTFVQAWGGQLSAAVIFVILARLLPPEAFGLVAYATVIKSFLQLAANAGLPQAVIRFERLEPEHLDTAFWTQAALSVVMSLGIVLVSEPLARLMGDSALAPILRWMTLGFVLSALASTPMARLRRELQMRQLAKWTLVAELSGGVLGVAMAVSGYGVWSLVGQQIFTSVVALAGIWKASDWHPGLRFSAPHLRDMLGFGLTMAGSNFLRLFTERVDRVMVGSLMGAASLGLYVVGARLLRLVIGTISAPINKVSLPVFSRLQGDPERMAAALSRAAGLNGLITVPITGGLVLVAPDLIPFAFGPQWADSVPVMQLLAVFGMSQAICSLNGPVIIAYGRAQRMMFIRALSAVITVAGIAAVHALGYGVVGVAGVIAVRGLVVLPIYLVGCAELLDQPVRSMLTPYVAPFGASLVMAGAVLALSNTLADATPMVRLGAMVVAGASVYAAVVWLLAPGLVRAVIDLGLRGVGPLGAGKSARPSSE